MVASQTRSPPSLYDISRNGLHWIFLPVLLSARQNPKSDRIIRF